MPPLERHPSLRPVSREHHHGLLLCWKLREGFAKAVEPSRMQAYCEQFFHQHLIPHFKVEEEAILPVLGNDHELVKRALKEHQELTKMFLSKDHDRNSLATMEKLLAAHIRFEERELFQAVQAIATTDQLENIELVHGHASVEPMGAVEEDAFWL